MDIVKERGIFYEKINDLAPVLCEEFDELIEELAIYSRFENNLDRIYSEIQDVSIVLLSLFNTVRLMKDGVIE